LNRKFSKEEIQVANKYMKKYSASLAIKEMKIKTTLRFHLTPVRLTIFKGQNQQQMLTRMSETRTLILLVEMQISTTTVESSMEIPQKAKDRTAK
jgi:hypothetical protein